MLTPARIVGTEILDAKDVDPAARERAQADIARSNVFFGGRRAVVNELRAVFAEADGRALTLLDVGTGLADIPPHARRIASQSGLALTTIGVDTAPTLLAAARANLTLGVAADALALPFRDASIDIVTCSQLLHHFHGAAATRLVAEMTRVARRAVVVADLRRSWVAAAGFWLAAWPLRFHAITRHDGVVSVLRGFTARELGQLVESATGVHALVRRHLGFRLTARWRPRARA